MNSSTNQSISLDIEVKPYCPFPYFAGPNDCSHKNSPLLLILGGSDIHFDISGGEMHVL